MRREQGQDRIFDLLIAQVNGRNKVMFRTSPFLRWVLFADAGTCLATGLLAMVDAEPLSQLSGLPVGLLRYAGLSLVPFAAFLVYLATRTVFRQSMAWTVILLNVLWTLDSILLLVTGWVTPTELGYVLVVVLAVGVAVLAGLEYVGLRKSMETAV